MLTDTVMAENQNAPPAPPPPHPTMADSACSPIVHLNVGGVRFTTSRQTLLSTAVAGTSVSAANASASSGMAVNETFFTALLSGRISSQVDETGAIFIDRDPDLFRIILNYLRARNLSLSGTGVSVKQLLHEAEYYGIASLARQLTLCAEIDESGCGDVLFYTYLAPPMVPMHEKPKPQTGGVAAAPQRGHSRNPSQDSIAANCSSRPPRPPQPQHLATPSTISRTTSSDPSAKCGPPTAGLFFGQTPGGWVDPLRVRIVTAHHNCIAVAYPHFVACFKQKENNGFQSAFTSPYLEQLVERVAINAKMGGSSSAGFAQVGTLVAVSYARSLVRLMGFSDDGSRVDVGLFNLHATVNHLFFIGTQLVALSPTGKIGVWNSMTQHWQSQELAAITSHDTAGTFLLLGSSNGSINYIDMQKFPLRMKDNDLLVTELYRDPNCDSITAISVYLTPKTSICGNWIEIAYGTSSGVVRVIVQHPETVGHGPQLFQTFSVHRSPVTSVKLSEKFLVSVCNEYNHVRTWGVTRFRGMISTQPGSTSVASFKIVSLEEAAAESGGSRPSPDVGNACGPYGEQDDEQVFVQKVVPDTDSLFVRLASNGDRVCVIRSVDGTTITSFCVHECEGSSRVGSRPRRFVITGHSSGAVQMWDLTTALEFYAKGDGGGGGGGGDSRQKEGGPTSEEMLRLLEHCDLSNSRTSTPCISPCSSVKVKAPNAAALAASVLQNAAYSQEL